MAVEFRVCWSADTNINFHGATKWERWENPEDGPEEVEMALTEDGDRLSEGLDRALLASGFNWWVETREAPGGE
jgi:hypothetical protein